MEKHVVHIQDDPALTPITWLSISDVTDGHTVEGFKDGRALSADGLEVLVLVVSSQFEKKGPLERQRMVNNVLSDDLNSGVLHSVRMRCLTPSQWEKIGKPKTFRPDAPCSIHMGNISNKTSSLPTVTPVPVACECGNHHL